MKTEPGPLDPSVTLTCLRHLAEQLSLEYAGAVAPGRVLSLVLTTGRHLRRQGYRRDDLLRLTKTTVRANLTTHIGTTLASRSLTPV